MGTTAKASFISWNCASFSDSPACFSALGSASDGDRGGLDAELVLERLDEFRGLEEGELADVFDELRDFHGVPS